MEGGRWAEEVGPHSQPPRKLGGVALRGVQSWRQVRVKGRGRVALPRTEAAPRRSRDLDQGSVPAEMIPNKSTRGPSAGSPPQSGG